MEVYILQYPNYSEFTGTFPMFHNNLNPLKMNFIYFFNYVQFKYTY